MSLIFSMPGKKGDALHQFPVAYWYCQQQEKRCTLWLDQKTLGPLQHLFLAQPCVEQVELKEGINSWHMGGQPYDFGLKTADFIGNEIYHLGFRKFPTRQITLEVLDQIPLKVDRGEVKGCLKVTPRPSSRRLILHGTFASHASGTPGFWRFLADHEEELKSLFDEIVFTGSPEERMRALELYPDFTGFDDHGDYLPLAELIAGAQAMIGAGSSNVVLAGLLGVPCIRVHDPIGEAPAVIWSNLGKHQFNLTELELRAEWPSIRDECFVAGALKT